jgi:nucleotide-binding universal stress UspA family protein
MVTIAPRTVVVGLDGSHSSWAALRWAADEAQRTGRRLLVVHSGDTRRKPVSADERPFGRALLCDAAASLVDSHPSLDVHSELASGDAAQHLCALSAQAEMVVIGRGNGLLPNVTLGSVARRVLMHAACPLIVVSQTDPSVNNRIVVGVGDGAGGKAALRFAFAEAAKRGAEVVAVRSWSPFEWQLTASAIPVVRERERAEHEILRRAIHPLREQFPDVPVRSVLSAEPVEIALRHETSNSVALVLGCRRADDALLGRMGPVTARAIKHFDLPVALVGRPAVRSPKPALHRRRTNVAPTGASAA